MEMENIKHRGLGPSSQRITRAYREALENADLPESPPEIDWGHAYWESLETTSQKWNAGEGWPIDVYQEVAETVWSDFLIGHNTYTDNAWKRSLVDFVERRQKQGKSDEDIRRIFQAQVRKKAINLSRKLFRQQSIIEHDRVSLRTRSENQEEDSHSGSSIVSEETVYQRRHVLQSLMHIHDIPQKLQLDKVVEQISKHMERHADFRERMLWRAFQDHPKRARKSRKALAKAPVDVSARRLFGDDVDAYTEPVLIDYLLEAFPRLNRRIGGVPRKRGSQLYSILYNPYEDPVVDELLPRINDRLYEEYLESTNKHWVLWRAYFHVLPDTTRETMLAAEVTVPLYRALSKTNPRLFYDERQLAKEILRAVPDLESYFERFHPKRYIHDDQIREELGLT